MTPRRRITFVNRSGLTLAAALEMPARPPRAFALFAHCFSCGKDVAAASRISRALAGHGIAVLRFDFTGLGRSEGDFGNENFSSNIADLLDAAKFLATDFSAPRILIGHSLGGTAVLAAAPGIASVDAVVTIGAPAAPDHVLAQFDDALETIEREGSAQVALAGRPFRIDRQFVDDVRGHPLAGRVGELAKPLLILHSPVDETVSIREADALFDAARHPKSFISVDGADHLLSDLSTAQFVAENIAAWCNRYLDDEVPDVADVPGGEVWIGEANHQFLRDVASDDHAWLADEPKRVGGSNLGPDPYEHLLAALGTCTSMTLRMYANRKGWPLDDVEVRVSHRREHAADSEAVEADAAPLEVLSRTIRLVGDLSADQKDRLMAIADRCPVHRTLENDLVIETLAAG